MLDTSIGTSTTEGHQLQEEEVWTQQPVEAEEEAQVDSCVELLAGDWGLDYASRRFGRMESFCC